MFNWMRYTPFSAQALWPILLIAAAVLFAAASSVLSAASYWSNQAHIADIQARINTKPQPPLDEQTKPAAVTHLLEPIVAAHLLGRLQPAAAKRQAALPRTKQQLVLVGIFTEEQGGKSSTLISSNNQMAKLYFETDKLPMGGIIKEIAANSVIIEVNQQLEVLYFPFHGKAGNIVNRFDRRRNQASHPQNGPESYGESALQSYGEDQQDTYFSNTQKPQQSLNSRLLHLKEKRKQHAGN